MKILKYKFVCHEINHGTDENPDIEQVIAENTVQCPDDLLEANLAIYRKCAINGEVIVEDGEPELPTTEQRVYDLEEQLAQSDETAIALYEVQEAQEVINAQQDEALMEIYEMIG